MTINSIFFSQKKAAYHIRDKHTIGDQPVHFWLLTVINFKVSGMALTIFLAILLNNIFKSNSYAILIYFDEQRLGKAPCFN